MDSRRALIIGRFNPFHNGHLAVIHETLALSSENKGREGSSIAEIILAIGSAEKSHTMKNPFTAGERIEMIRGALFDDGIPLERILIIPISDIMRNALWVTHIESLCPSFSVVITNNSLCIRLFSEAGYQVINPKLVDRDEFSGTEVRRRIHQREDWKRLVPNFVAKVLETNQLITRIIDASDTNK